MRIFSLAAPDDFDGWREGARAALAAGLDVSQIRFEAAGDTPSLFADTSSALPSRFSKPPVVPKAFLDLARETICHIDPVRFDLLYCLLVRLQSDKHLLSKTTDNQVHKANRLAKEVRRDRHKMKAFVRFRKVGETGDGMEQFVAWFEPTHHIVRLTASFFVRRFAGMHWSILTPDACAHWDGTALSFSEGVPKSQAPKEDALEDYWRSYYAAIFNPARLKTDAMQSEMPKKYWKNLPEASLIPSLIQDAREREQQMVEKAPTTPLPGMMKHREIAVEEQVPALSEIRSTKDLAQALKGCQACPLWQPATQAVAGAGTSRSNLMLVGEQPGDREDLSGQPFVGPAGQLLRSMFEEISLNADEIYLTNAVKHFKFTPRGKRRIHQNPRAGEIDACRFWLQKEIALVRPKVIVALGASAIRGITGRTGSVSKMRGAPHDLSEGRTLIVTNHPSALLRMSDEQVRAEAKAAMLSDLKHAVSLAAA